MESRWFRTRPAVPLLRLRRLGTHPSPRPQDFAYRANQTAWILLLSTDLALVVAVLTVRFQAARAARTDPVATLRYEQFSYRPKDTCFDGLTTDSLIWDGYLREWWTLLRATTPSVSS